GASFSGSGPSSGFGSDSGSGSGSLTGTSTTAGSAGAASGDTSTTGGTSTTSSGTSAGATGSISGSAAVSVGLGCSVCASSLGFLRNQPNRPFFSPDSTGGFLSSLEPNMGTNISRGRHATAPRRHRTRSIPAFSGAGPTDVAAVNSVEYPSISPPAGVKTARAARKVPL